MNVNRIAILGAAAIAAGAAAFLVRGMLGGGTPESAASIPATNYATVDVLVASADIPAGRPLTVNDVRWQAWPKNALASAYTTRATQPDIGKAVEGSVVRAPLFSGEPITPGKVIKAQNASFMSATLSPGMRAVSIKVEAETTAGGFILPNDRVDVVQTREVGDRGDRNFQATTILRDIRVLAIDQTAKSDQNTQSAVGKTATLELTDAQAELIAQAQAGGTLTLALRALGDVETALRDENRMRPRQTGAINVIRYGVARGAAIMGRGQ